MKASSTLLLQTIIAVTSVAVLSFLLWEPHIEGRNAHATISEIYFNDPFLAYVYLGSIPFFIALYRTFRLLGHVGQTGSFSRANVDALQGIKRCALANLVFVAGGMVIILVAGDAEDRPAGVFMSFLATLPSSIIVIAAAMFARNVRAVLRQPEGSRG